MLWPCEAGPYSTPSGVQVCGSLGNSSPLAGRPSVPSPTPKEKKKPLQNVSYWLYYAGSILCRVHSALAVAETFTHGTASGELEVYSSWERLFLGDPCLPCSERGQMCCCRGRPRGNPWKSPLEWAEVSEGRGRPEGGGRERVFCERWRGLGVRCRTDRCRLNTSLLTAEEWTRAVRELSTATSAERNRLYCRSDCGLDCAEGQWNWGRGGAKILPESASCSAVESTKMILSWET